MRPLHAAAVILALLGAALLAPARGDEDSPAALPGDAAELLAKFREVDWKDRLKPERGPTPRAGWITGLRTEWRFATLEPTYQPALEKLLRDEDRFVRTLAARSLGIQGETDAAPALAKALDGEKDPMTLRTIVEALGRVGGPEQMPKLDALQQKSGQNKDVKYAIGLTRRQIKGGRWDVASIRGEHRDALRSEFAALKLGEPPPELALPSPDGPFNLSLFKGQAIVIVFVHGDKGPKDNRVLTRLRTEQEFLDRERVVVVMIDPHEKERTGIWRDRAKLPYKVASDPSGRAAAAYGVGRQLVFGSEWLPSPAWFIIDERGRLVWQRIGKKIGDHASLGDIMPILRDVTMGVDILRSR